MPPQTQNKAQPKVKPTKKCPVPQAPLVVKQRRIVYLLTALSHGDYKNVITEKWKMLMALQHVGLDVRMIAFGQQRPGVGPKDADMGLWETTVQKDGTLALENTDPTLEGFHDDIFADFVADNYDPGNTHLVVGTHGLGDYFWLKFLEKGHYVEKSYPVERFVGLLGHRQFLSVVLDCCLMGELYTALNFGQVAPVMCATQGFMWTDDRQPRGSIFNAAMARGLSDPGVPVIDAIRRANTAYVYNCPEGYASIGIYNTAAAKALVDYLVDPKNRYLDILAIQQYEANHSWDTAAESPFVFYNNGPDDDGSWDAQYLLDVGRMFKVRKDPCETTPPILGEPRPLKDVDQHGLGLLAAVVWSSTLPQAPNDFTDYKFDVSGLSVTVSHVEPMAPPTAAAVAASEPEPENTEVVVVPPAALAAVPDAAVEGEEPAKDLLSDEFVDERRAESVPSSGEVTPHHTDPHNDSFADAPTPVHCTVFEAKPGTRGPLAKICTKCRKHVDLHE